MTGSSRMSSARFEERARDERGAVSSMVGVLGFAIFLSLALVVDGGRQLGALVEAQNLADNAARYGSQEVDLDQWRATGVPELIEADARQRVDFYMNNLVSSEINVVGHRTTVAVDTVTVEVTVRRRRFFFVPTDAVATESATALDGVVNP